MQKYDRAINANVTQEKNSCFIIRLVRGKRFSLTSRELYRAIFCLNKLLIFACVYLLTKITLGIICHELSKQPSEFTLN